MGFISYNLEYFKKKIEYYENNALKEEDISEAKRLLKLVDDLVDEGYNELSISLQIEFGGVDRLKEIIKRNNELPFGILSADEYYYGYKKDMIGLSDYADKLVKNAGDRIEPDKIEFIKEVKNFSESIGYNDNTAYIFLLRDTFLPFLYFKSKYKENIYPWIISRQFFDLIYKDGHIDDIIRTVIFDGLEKYDDDNDKFEDYCKREIIKKSEMFPEIFRILRELFSQINNEKITIIETGCYGTFPMLLSAIDKRADFKMYTTVPYLVPIYKNKIFTEAYENLRTFETFASHDKLFKLAGFKNNEFYVAESVSREIVSESLNEIGFMLK